MRVAVLLSAFRGEAFLKDQIASICGQHGVEVTLLVRDDGSGDGTLAALQALRQQYDFELTCGPNLGVIGSFFALVQAAPADADFFAFADQDDWWLPDKLARAVEALGAMAHPERPQLYCSAVTVTDEALHPRRRVGYRRVRPGFANALVENIAPGCTMVFNRAAWEKLRQSVSTAKPIIHDWWLYQVAAAFGEVCYDVAPRILYRQHGGNVIGTPTSRWRQLYGRMKRFWHYDGVLRLRRQALEFQRCYGAELAPEDRRILEDFLAPRPRLSQRLGYALRCGTYRQRLVDTLILRALITVGRV